MNDIFAQYPVREFCISCDEGTMQKTDELVEGYTDVYFCTCPVCGYRDASVFYHNLQYLTSNPLRSGKDEKTDGI
jgi:hypothetical protein